MVGNAGLTRGTRPRGFLEVLAGKWRRTSVSEQVGQNINNTLTAPNNREES